MKAIAVLALVFVAITPLFGNSFSGSNENVCYDAKDDTRNIILMQNGTITTCSASFYDTGGATGSYQNNENYTLTLLPASSGAQIMVTFTAFNVENNWDFLKIYNGTSASAPQLANLTGTTLPTQPYIASNAQGALTFVFTSDVSVTAAGWAATVACFIQVENNLAALRLAGNNFGVVGQQQTISVIVKNMGTNNVIENSYSVQLLDNNDNILGTTSGLSIESNMQLAIPVSFAPSAEGNLPIKGRIVFDADQDLTNNETTFLAISVHPSGTYISAIGQGVAELYMPFQFNYHHSLAQTIYYADEIGIDGGLITKLQYKSTSIGLYPDKPIKIWLGETDRVNLNTGWVDPSTLTLVYDGTIDIPVGMNDILIPLQTQYNYNGGNLVIYTHKAEGTWTSFIKFIGTLYPNSGRSRKVQQDNTPFDPTTPPAGTIDHNAPNIQIIMSTVGLGSLQGTVTSLANPVSGAIAKLLNTHNSATTNTSGFYHFPYLIGGNYNMEFSKHGFETAIVENVSVVGNEATVVDVNLTPIMQYMVTGTVTASDTNLGLEGAEISLKGYTNYTATSNAEGNFGFPNVYGGGREYEITVKYPGYSVYTSVVTVNNADITNLDVVVIEIPFPAKKVKAEIDGENVLVTWKEPYSPFSGTPQMLMWDNGENDDAIGTGGAANFDVAHRYSPEILQELEVGGMSITKVTFWPNVSSASYAIRIWTGGTAAAPHELAYEQAVVAPPVGVWNEIVLDIPFVIDDTRELWIGYNVNTNTGYPAGCDAGPRVEGFGNMIYFNNAWTTLYQLAPTQNVNWNIHAWVDNAKELDLKLSRIAAGKSTSAPKVILENGKSGGKNGYLSSARETGQFNIAQNPSERGTKMLLNYSVYRFIQGQEMANWTELATAVTDTFFVDNTWSEVASGSYQYAVVSNYTNNVTSNPAFSNILAKDMEVEFTLNITTNAGEPATGAVVTLVNIDNDPTHAYTLTAGETGVTFPAVWLGAYNLTISKYGFHTYTVSNIVINEAGFHTAQLIEKIVEPFGLVVSQIGMNLHFSWNNTTGFSDDMESYESFIIENIGEYTLVDVDGASTYEIENTTFPNSGYDGSYIVFNPSATTPALTDAAWQAHSGSKYLACFAGTNPPNNDWIITPEVTITPGMVFSFWAKSVTDQYGLERFKVGVSAGGTAPANFTIISAGSFIQAPVVWTQYTYPLVAYMGQTVRLAIQCVSNDAFAFLVDDISLGVPRETSKSFLGYTVFFDNEEVATGIQQTNYTFPMPPCGQHSVGVRSDYTSGSSNIIRLHYYVSCPYLVTFWVRRSGGIPVVGAEIQINGHTLVTNNQGRAYINLDNGLYDYVVTIQSNIVLVDQVEVNGSDVVVYIIDPGISDKENSDNCQLYPNPAKETLTVWRNISEPAIIELYSVGGELVKKSIAESDITELTISDLPTGVYFVRIVGETRTETRRFVKE
jgi:hypothetical protein